MKMKRLMSWLLVLSLVFTMISFKPSAYAAVSGNVLGGQETAGCLRVTVNNGNIFVERYNGTSYVGQYYTAADAVLDVSGSLYSLGTYFNSSKRIAVQTQTGNAQSIVTTWTTAALQITQTVTLPSLTAQYIKLQWTVKNIGNTAMTNLHFLRGEDTYLSGGDNGAGYWDAATNSIGVSKVIDGVTQRLFMQGITAPNSYISAFFSTVRSDVANGGELSKEINSDESTDNGYAMEWKCDSLNAGATWTIKAIESFISSAVTASGSTVTVNSVTGSAITLDYTAVNSSSTSQAVTYSVTAPDGWTAVPDKTSETLSAGATSTVHVSVTPPANAANGTYDIILNVGTSGSEVQAISTVTIVQNPAAPNVTADDENNILVGADDTMEYSTDGGSTWLPYDSSNAPKFVGNSTVQIRVAANGGIPAGNITTVNFTIAAAAADDSGNVLVNVDSTMEYSTDNGATWTNYDPGNAPTFDGGTTVLVRERAGEAVKLNFAAGTVSGSAITVVPGSNVSVSGSAITVSGSAISVSGSMIVVDFSNHNLVSTDNSMEYSLDNGVTWTACTADAMLSVPADASVLVRKKAGSTNTIHFTDDPVIPAAPAVTVNDSTNTIVGANRNMEYSTDGGTSWADYDSTNTPVFNGNKSVKIRVKAGDAVTINYAAGTINGSSINVVTGSAISSTAITVRADFTQKKLIGVYKTMEYSTDNGVTWSSCNSSQLTFPADTVVLLRTKAGNSTILNFTTNPAAAPAVTANDNNKVLVGADSTMEYSTDNGTTWTGYNASNPPLFNGNYTVLVRVKASGEKPASESVTLHFTQRDIPSRNPETNSDTKSDTASTRKVDVSVGSEPEASVEIVRSNVDNKAVDTITLDKTVTEETLKNSKASDNKVSLYISADKEKAADEINVNVKADSLKLLSDANKSLEIKTDDVTITLSDSSLKNLEKQGEDLYFRIVPVKDESQKQAAIDNTLASDTVKLYAKYKDIEVYGAPMTIETNYKNQATTVIFSLKGITLPSDPELREKVLKNLAVYVQHSDGDKEIIPGTIVNDADGNPIGVQIGITKFSTFTLISTTNTAPKVSAVKINGIAKQGKVLKVSYTYSDADKDKEGKTSYQWFRADNAAGKNKVKIASENTSSYTVTKKDQGKYLICNVTPAAKDGILKGKSVSAAKYVAVSKKTEKHSDNTSKTAVKEKAEKVVTYAAQVKLGLIGSKAYANQIAKIFTKTYHAGNVAVKKEGSYYRVTAEFTNKAEAGKVCKEMKNAKLITNYYIG